MVQSVISTCSLKDLWVISWQMLPKGFLVFCRATQKRATRRVANSSGDMTPRSFFVRSSSQPTKSGLSCDLGSFSQVCILARRDSGDMEAIFVVMSLLLML